MIKKGLILFGIIILLLFLKNNCSYSDSITGTSTQFTLSPDSGAIFKLTHHYFILVPGDTALFYGYRNCTTTVNGVISSCTNDSAYLRTITLEGKTITINDSTYAVFPQLYQQSSTFEKINENTITRYFKKTDSMTLQIAYEEKGRIYPLEKDKRIVMPRTVIIGPYGWFDTDSTKVPVNNKWPASPLIRKPVISDQGDFLFNGYSVATKPIALQGTNENAYHINGHNYTDGMFVKTYYSLSGDAVENNMVIRTLGSVVVTRSYFINRGIIDISIVTSLQRTYSNGTVEMKRETVYVARGYEGAPIITQDTSH
jgi:hypothetical protein